MMILRKRGSTCLIMSKPIISSFNFGQIAVPSVSQDKKNIELPPDNLILVDAYWDKEGMKIRFIPHQMIGITLKVVFVFEYNNSTHDKDKAKFELYFGSPDTIYSNQKPQRITIKGNDIKNNILKDHGRIVTKDNRNCYYYEVKNFSSDLSRINQ